MRTFQLLVILSVAALTSSALAQESSPQHLKFVEDSGLPTAHVTLDGVEAKLFIDLGAYKAIALTKAAQARVPVSYSQHSDRFRDSSGHVFTRRTFKVAELSAGTFHARNLEGIEFALSPGVGAFPQDGYLGFGLLKNYALIFDFPAGQLTLYPPSTPRSVLEQFCGPHSFSMRTVDGVLQSHVETDRGEFVFQWDTGSRETILRPSAFGSKANSVSHASSNSFAFDKFAVGAQDFGRTRLVLREFSAPNVDGVIGSDFLQNKVFCVSPRLHLGWVKQ